MVLANGANGATLVNGANGAREAAWSGSGFWLDSVLVSNALITTHDALAETVSIPTDEALALLGAWDARRQRRDEQPDAFSERYRRLGPDWRAAILDGELLGAIDVRGDGSSVDVVVGNGSRVKLCTIHRPSNEIFATELAMVHRYADLRPERLAEIDVQGSEFLAFFAALDRIDPSRTPWTIELVGATLRLCTVVVQRVKLHLDCARPVDLSPRIQPMIPTPDHGTCPAGHATGAFAVATVLSRLIPGPTASCDDGRDRLTSPRFQLAARIANNRVVAGVHFPVDNFAGAMLGVQLGEWIAATARNAGGSTGFKLSSRRFNAVAGEKLLRDFHPWSFANAMAEPEQQPGISISTEQIEVVGFLSPALAALWKAARAEWS